MVSAFEVYLVMQLDDIRCAALFFGLAIGVIGVTLTAHSLDYREKIGFAGPATLVFAFVLLAADAFTPSSKTAAAMILVPALTDKQVTEPLTAEAKELYALAKQALTNVAQADKPEEPKPEK